MNKNRLLELAGMKKAVGNRKVFMLNESETLEEDAKAYVRGLPIYKELMKDSKAKPAALKAATSFVKDMGDGPISPKAKKFITNQLGDIAADANPRGSMMSKNDDAEESDPADAGDVEAQPEVAKTAEKKLDRKVEISKEKKEKAANPSQGRKGPSEGRAAAQKWLASHPNATAKEFVGVAVNAGMAKNSARSLFYKMKKKMAECFIIKKGDQVLSERSRPLIPHFIAQDDFNTEYYVFESKKRAEEAKDNFLLHVSEKMEIVELGE